MNDAWKPLCGNLQNTDGLEYLASVRATEVEISLLLQKK